MQFYASSNLECKSVSLQEVYPWERGKFNTTMTENTHVEYIDNNNYMDYVRRMMEYCLDKGIRAQVDAFTWGFERVFPMDWLSVFSCSELEGIICGQQTDSPWSEAELSACIEPSFTLDKSSSTFRYFVKVLAGLNAAQRSQFLRWSTGYANLPVGGMKNHDPPIKLSPANQMQGPYPRVQTCFHEISLPEYTSASELRSYLLEAISQEAFEIN
nr:hypothetical transcript [Hymenolepis microstoma]